jgi:hypothetical protein
MSSFLETTHRNILWFKRAMDANELEMAPPFQRNLVWTNLQKSYLIDTILRGYPIPELYLQDIVKPDATQTHIVVDGQQRIRACLEYLEGKFSLDGPGSADFGNASFDELSGDNKQKIYSYKFVIRLLPDAPETTLREIFQRLNRNNVALNQQELRQATYQGPFIQTMNRLAENSFWTESGIFTPNDVRRMLDVEFISELAIGILHGLQNKKQSLEKWYTVYEVEFEQQRVVEETFATVLGELVHLIPNFTATRWRKKSDFYTLFLVLADHVNRLPLSSEKRMLATDRLVAFQRQVTEFIKETSPQAINQGLFADVEGDSDNSEQTQFVEPESIYETEIAQYAGAVQRAASDLSNRKRRASALEGFLGSVWTD